MEGRYQDLSEAARGVLCDAVSIANEAGQPFVVIGGWSPFLLNSAPIVHPGTRDVDLLFERGATVGQLEQVVGAFLRRGYLSSAKHSFQLLRPVQVRDREFVFNVDFLHCDAQENASELFADHLVLKDGPLLYRYQSILVPLSSLLFEKDGHLQHRIEGTLPDGREVEVTLPLMNELGTLLTKSASMFGVKRPRDAFDIMLAICQARDCAWLSDAIRQNDIADRLESLWSVVTDGTLRKNIIKYWHDASEPGTWASTAEQIAAFLESAGIENPAQD
jgi:hypothetical protein